ncbi:hypothetical protein GCM10019017_69090 [Streptomyces showdoensis]
MTVYAAEPAPGWVAPEQPVTVARAAVQTRAARSLGVRKETHPFTGVETCTGDAGGAARRCEAGGMERVLMRERSRTRLCGNGFAEVTEVAASDCDHI